MDEQTEEYYENIFARWKKNSQMHRISLSDMYLDKLDKPYINQDIIIIKDDRTDGYYYSNCPPEYIKNL